MKQIDSDIAELNLECISYKICRDEGWELGKVDDVEMKYRIFLQLLRNAEHPIAPTVEIDQYWHCHILDTKKYHDDCNLLFGHYIHHYPYSGVFGEEDANAQKKRVSDTVLSINQYLI